MKALFIVFHNGPRFYRGHDGSHRATMEQICFSFYEYTLLVPWALSHSHRDTMRVIVATMERVSGANPLFALFFGIFLYSCLLLQVTSYLWVFACFWSSKSYSNN
jgi:hypothetical protein